ncbi:MAG: hypothetical protein MI974_33975 [Chitinophagales bacterium]|nr:hypothetical protein [Chitinophagales bacterium]
MFFTKLTTKSALLLLLLSVISFSACDNDDEEPITETQDFSSQLTNITNNVILATYDDLAGKANTLLTEVEKLEADRTAINLNNARGAWRDARAPWESSEGFLFGPVDTKGIDPAIDDWPVNVIDLDGVLASNDVLTEPFIDGLETGLKGFHTIEYLLWGADGSKEIGNFTDREFEYLLATVENLKNKTQVLADSWSASNEDYGSNLINAGESGSLFVSQKAALEQLVEAIVGICDEVGSGKIAGPLGDSAPNPVEEESRFSHNSKNDFANNMRSISNIYNGSYNVGNGGLTDIILDQNAALDKTVQDAITAAISSIENIPGNFSDAIFDDRSDVENAKDKVLELKQILEEQVTPIISGL